MMEEMMRKQLQLISGSQFGRFRAPDGEWLNLPSQTWPTFIQSHVLEAYALVDKKSKQLQATVLRGVTT